MVIAVTIKTKGVDKLIRLTKVLPKNLRKDITDSNHSFAQLTRDSLKKELMATSKRYNNKIFNSIIARRKSKFTSTVTLAREGVWLDSMKPHFVSLKRGRNITKWARSKGINARAIYVRPHPFIDKGLRRARKRLDKELRKGVRKAFRRSLK